MVLGPAPGNTRQPLGSRRDLRVVSPAHNSAAPGPADPLQLHASTRLAQPQAPAARLHELTNLAGNYSSAIVLTSTSLSSATPFGRFQCPRSSLPAGRRQRTPLVLEVACDRYRSAWNAGAAKVRCGSLDPAMRALLVRLLVGDLPVAHGVNVGPVRRSRTPVGLRPTQRPAVRTPIPPAAKMSSVSKRQSGNCSSSLRTRRAPRPGPPNARSLPAGPRFS